MVRTNIIFGYDVYAWYAGRSLRDYYLDKHAAWDINRLARARIAETFGWQVGVKMPYLAYASLTALGAAIAYPPDGQPMVASPIIRSPADLDALPPLGDITQVGAIAHLIDMWHFLSEQEGKVVALSLGNEAPATAAVLLRGTDFLMDVYDNPGFAHRLLERVTELFIQMARCHRQLTGRPAAGGEVGLADDFAGLLPPVHYRTFVIPCYNRIYEELGAARRSLHSELLRPEHLPVLAEFKLDHFDPHVDQYLSVRDMVEKLPAGIGWNWRILSAHVVTGKPAGLVREFEEAVGEGARDFHVAISAPVKAENVRAVAEVAQAHGELTVS